MTTNEWLKTAEIKLKDAGISTARLDCLILLEDTTGKDRSWVLAHPEFELTDRQIKTLCEQTDRRAKHEPLAYIRGKSAFYGREFFVNEHTLQPRPETETMIELLLSNIKNNGLKVEKIVDVGTGSGCIAITAKLELPNCKVLATDISDECLKIAEKNAKELKADVSFYKGNLIESPPLTIDFTTAILANLPYVPDEFTINQAAMFEPRLAIFGGNDGLDYYCQLFEQINKLDQRPGILLTESLPTQHQDLKNIATKNSYKLVKTEDFIQVFKKI